MKGYIYTMYRGADPGAGWRMTDPLFGKPPTLGACMPNIRRVVSPGDYIFVISGKVPLVKQYVVGGFQVAEKIKALQAYKRFPENRLRELPDGSVAGNIIVKNDGTHHQLDHHSGFRRRIENYIVGKNPIIISAQTQIDRAREESLEILARVFDKKGESVKDIIARWRRLEEDQVHMLLGWLKDVKRRGAA